MTAPTEDLIARIETEVRAWETTRDDGSSGLTFEALLTEAAQALRALQQEVERLRGALEPFAKAADKLDSLWPEDDWRWNDSVRSNVTVRDIRRARSALTGSAQG